MNIRNVCSFALILILAACSAPAATPTLTPLPTSTPYRTALAQIAAIQMQIATNQAKIITTADAIKEAQKARDNLLKQMRADGAIILNDVTTNTLPDWKGF